MNCLGSTIVDVRPKVQKNGEKSASAVRNMGRRFRFNMAPMRVNSFVRSGEAMGALRINDCIRRIRQTARTTNIVVPVPHIKKRLHKKRVLQFCGAVGCDIVGSDFCMTCGFAMFLFASDFVSGGAISNGVISSGLVSIGVISGGTILIFCGSCAMNGAVFIFGFAFGFGMISGAVFSVAVILGAVKLTERFTGSSYDVIGGVINLINTRDHKNRAGVGRRSMRV